MGQPTQSLLAPNPWNQTEPKKGPNGTQKRVEKTNSSEPSQFSSTGLARYALRVVVEGQREISIV